ncbi:ArsR/SmtB family transcription factor [uncultured Roseovarius sp.]|uniref:ArsR/SmtB family transcription factor n=1 Tax=Roseovarius sp. TaxID=1486281 RepID=UPI0025D4AA15|nr:metalloregulator ArsR/SmtB family transcription factor [uncultured Roseovarius sp.]
MDIIGAALADASRMRILCELMDGRAFTNKELACAADISPQTASVHLKVLEAAGFTASLRSGRHVYHRIAGPEVAEVLEKLSSLSPSDHLMRRSQGAKTVTDALLARSCYNHMAGRLGVLITERLAALGVIRLGDETVTCGPQCRAFCDRLGIAMPKPGAGKPLVKLCLDWTERRHHISGPLATAILERALAMHWLDRRAGSRALMITADGYAAFDLWFGLGKEAIDGAGAA